MAKIQAALQAEQIASEDAQEQLSAEEEQTHTQQEGKRSAQTAEPHASFLPPYKVILYNDDRNDMLFVVAVLLHLVDHMSQTEATKIMLTAHLTGRALVVVCPKERAEYYQERLAGYGLSATIEAA